MSTFTSDDLKETHRAPTHLLSLPAAVGDSSALDSGSVFFVGTATVIIRYAGFTILTDPNFLHAGDHVHLGFGIHAQRLTNPAIELEEVNSATKIDFIILSHMHEDHFDKFVQEHLNKDIPIITTSHAVSALKELGFKRLFPLETWEKILILREKSENYVSLTSMPGQHTPTEMMQKAQILPPVMGSLLEFGVNKSHEQAPGKEEPLYRIYISGDTLIYDDLKLIPQRFPNINLGLFHLGGTTLPMGIVVTMDAKMGIEAIRIINPHKAIPIHYNDYDRFKSPLEDFKKEVDNSEFKDRVHYLAHGETYDFKVPVSK